MADLPSRDTIRTSNVFLDTQVVDEANFNYASQRIRSLIALAEDGQIQVFLTDITLREIKSHLTDAIRKAVSVRPHPVLRNSALPRVTALLEPLDAVEIEEELLTQLDDFIRTARATILPIEGGFLEPVLRKYFDRQPPFGDGKNKAEFPDALVLVALEKWCREHGQTMAVVTRDQGMKAACVSEGPLLHFEDLPEYLDSVSSENEVSSAFVRTMIPKHHAGIFPKAKDAFPTHGFLLIDQDGEVGEVELTSVDYDGDVEIISLGEDGAIVEMPATLVFQADVTYNEPGTGTYDHEDGIMLFQDTVEETVTRTVHRSISAEVTYDGLDAESFQVHGVWFEIMQDIEVESDYHTRRTVLLSPICHVGQLTTIG